MWRMTRFGSFKMSPLPYILAIKAAQENIGILHLAITQASGPTFASDSSVGKASAFGAGGLRLEPGRHYTNDAEKWCQQPPC